MYRVMTWIAYSLLLTAVACTSRETVPGPVQLRSAAGSAPSGQSAAAAPSGDVAGPALTDFSCELAPAAVPATFTAGGKPANIKVRLTNRSKADETWPALLPGRSPIHAVNLAYDWNIGEVWTEGARAMLPADLKAGQTVELELAVTPPANPGAYTLRIEPVQESVAWFSQNGGCHQDYKITVTR